VISNKGERLGEYDFFFEWFKPPTTDQVEALIEKIDETLEPLGVRYTITTKRR
jgi:5,10-methylenetetrahydrofolate reductase